MSAFGASGKAGVVVTALVLVMVGAAVPLSGQARAQGTPSASPVGTPAVGGARVFEVPGEAVYPEGVTYAEGENAFYVGSAADGTIYRGDLASGQVAEFSPAGADGRTSALGMKVDAEGRLIVAGGQTGRVFVYDTASGALLNNLRNDQPEGATFLNDVALSPSGEVFVTDSFSPTLYRVADDALAGGTPTAGATPEAGVALEPFVSFADTPFTYGEGINANGIVATDDGAFLLVVQTNTGNLYRIEVATRAVTQVDLAGQTLTQGDGMYLDGRLLYVVRNQDEQIVPVGLGEDFAAGQLSEPFTDPSFAFPTTIAAYNEGGCLLVSNAQFNAQESGTPQLPFTVSGIPIPGIGAAVGEAATPVATPGAAGC